MDGKTVLVVDDDPIIKDVEKNVLEKNGFSVITASSYKEVLEIVNNEELDLMLLDIMLPEVDGEAILQITKNNAYLEKPFPIVFVSGKDKGTVNMDGADGFLAKPFTNEQLMSIVNEVLAKKKEV